MISDYQKMILNEVYSDSDFSSNIQIHQPIRAMGVTSTLISIIVSEAMHYNKQCLFIVNNTNILLNISSTINEISGNELIKRNKNCFIYPNNGTIWFLTEYSVLQGICGRQYDLIIYDEPSIMYKLKEIVGLSLPSLSMDGRMIIATNHSEFLRFSEEFQSFKKI